jgi:extradiol dioxygenase family protein
MRTSFHVSLPCKSIKSTKSFYSDNIGATLGRNTQGWADINLFGNQLTFIKAKKFNFNNPNYVFEGKILPSFHFGIVLEENVWEEIYSKLRNKKLNLVEENKFLKDKSGEHNSFFIKDPNDYMLEFKCFKNPENIFR